MKKEDIVNKILEIYLQHLRTGNIDTAKAVRAELENWDAYYVGSDRLMEDHRMFVAPIDPISTDVPVSVEPDERSGRKKISSWAVKYDSCVVCHETVRKHMGKGKCTRCYFIKESNVVDSKPATEPVLEAIVDEKPTCYCHNIFCQNRRVPYMKRNMHKVGEMYFCSKSCALTNEDSI